MRSSQAELRPDSQFCQGYLTDIEIAVNLDSPRIPRVSVTKGGGSLKTPSSLKKSRPKSIRFAEIHRYIGKNKKIGEKNHLGQHPVSPGQHSESVRIEVGEIRSEEQINILLTLCSCLGRMGGSDRPG